MTHLKSLLGFGIIILISGLLACEGPAGPEGPQGQQGEQGEQGSQGPEGPAGNANVVSINLSDDDITWTEGDYLGRTSNVFSLDTTAVSQDIMDHGIVLGYFNQSGVWFALPLTWENEDGSSRQYILHSYSLNTITLYAYQTSGVLFPLGEYRFLLITDNTVQAKENASGNSVVKLLEGVDTSDYYEVMDYFGLEY